MFHRTVLMTPPDPRVEIDANIAPLIQACWDAGLRTKGCCEGYPFSEWRDDENPAWRRAYIVFGDANMGADFVLLGGLSVEPEGLTPRIARYATDCDVCGSRIVRGEPILWRGPVRRNRTRKGAPGMASHARCRLDYAWAERGGTTIRFFADAIPAITNALARARERLRARDVR